MSIAEDDEFSGGNDIPEAAPMGDDAPEAKAAPKPQGSEQFTSDTVREPNPFAFHSKRGAAAVVPQLPQKPSPAPDKPAPAAPSQQDQQAAASAATQTQAAADIQGQSNPLYTHQMNVMRNNSDYFQGVDNDPIKQDQLALTARFVNGGGDKGFSNLEPKEKTARLKQLATAQAEDEYDDYNGKDRSKKVTARTNQLMGSVGGLSNLKEFQPPVDPEKARRAAAKKDPNAGFGTYAELLGAKVLEGGFKGIGGVLDLVGSGYDHLTKDKDQIVRDAIDEHAQNIFTSLGKSMVDGANAEPLSGGLKSQAQKDSEAELHAAMESGTKTDVVKAVLGNPRLWLTGGADLIGQIGATGGAGGLARTGLVRGIGLASKALAASRAVTVAGGLLPDAALVASQTSAGANKHSAWEHVDSSPDDYTNRSKTDIFRDVHATLAAGGKRPTYAEVDAGVRELMKHNKLVGEFGIQAATIAMGGGVAGALNRAAGGEVGSMIGGKLSGLASSRLGKGALGMVESGSVNAGSTYASGLNEAMTARQAMRGPNYKMTPQDYKDDERLAKETLVAGFAGAAFGLLHAVGRRPSDEAKVPGDTTKVPSAAPAAAPAAEPAAAPAPSDNPFGQRLLAPPRQVDTTHDGSVINQGSDAIHFGSPESETSRQSTLQSESAPPGETYEQKADRLERMQHSDDKHAAIARSNPELLAEAKPIADTLTNDPAVKHVTDSIAQAMDDTFGEGTAAKLDAQNHGTVAHASAISKPADMAKIPQEIAQPKTPVTETVAAVTAQDRLAGAYEVYPAALQDKVFVKQEDGTTAFAKGADAFLRKHLKDAITAQDQPGQVGETARGIVEAAKLRNELNPDKPPIAGRMGKMFTPPKDLPKMVSEGIEKEESFKAAEKVAVPHARVKAIAAEVGQKLKALAINTHVFHDAEDMLASPDYAGKSEEERDWYAKQATGAAFFDPTRTDGRHVTVFSSKIKNEEHARYVLEHEILGHVGPMSIMGDKINDVFNAMHHGIAGGDKELNKIWSHVKSAYPTAAPEYQMNEVLARIAKTSDTSSGIQNILSAYAQKMSESGFSTLFPAGKLAGKRSLGIADMKALLGEVHKIASDKTQTAEVNRFTAYGYEKGTQQALNKVPEVLDMTKAQKVRKQLFDAQLPMILAGKAMGSGPRFEMAVRARETKRQMYADGDIVERLARPAQKVMQQLTAKHKLTIGETMMYFDRLASDTDTPKYNEYAMLRGGDLDEAKSKQREDAINRGLKASYEAGLSNVERVKQIARGTRTEIEALFGGRDSAAYQKQLAEVRHSNGMTNAEAAARLQDLKVSRPELYESLKNLNDTTVQALREKVAEHNHASGRWNPFITELAGRDKYTPQRGTGEGRRPNGKLRMPSDDRMSQFNSKQTEAEGRQSQATHGFNGLIDEGNRAAGRRANNELLHEFVSDTKRSATETGTDKQGRETHKGIFADTVQHDQISFKDGEFQYPERPQAHEIGQLQSFDPESGQHTTATLKDTHIAEALSRSVNAGRESGLERLSRMTNTYGRLLTSWNPFFAMMFLARDVQNEMAIIAGERKGLRDAALARGDHEAAAKLGSGPVFAAAKAMKVLGSTLITPFSNSDAGKFFRSTPGERSAMMEQWKQSGYKGDVEKFQYLKDFHEDGGISGYSKALLPDRYEDAYSPSRNPLSEEFWEHMTGHKVGLKEPLERFTESIDSARRFSLYSTLREMGVDRYEAANRARNSMDYNRRGAAMDGTGGRVLNAAFMFTGANMATVEHTFENRIWRTGEKPLVSYKGLDGKVAFKLKDGWQKELNWPVMATMVGAGAANYLIASMMMGNDSNTDEENVRKVPLFRWAQGMVIPAGGDGAFVHLPGAYGMQRVLQGLGAMTTGLSLGHHEASDVARELYNNTVEQMAPLSPIKGALQIPEQGSYMGQFVRGIMPDVLKPMAELALNQKFTGGKIHRDADPRNPKFASDSGYASTPPIFGKFAKMMQDTVGLDAHPEVYRHMSEQAGIMGPAMMAVASAFGDLNDGLSASKDLLAKGLLRYQDPAQGYEGRQLQHKLETMFTPLAKLHAREKARDQEEAGGMTDNKHHQAGPNERAFLDAHPEFLATQTAYRNYGARMAILSSQLKASLAEGDQDRASDVKGEMRRMQMKFNRAIPDDDSPDLQALKRIGK